MTYISVATCAVPTANKDAFIAHSNEVMPILKKLGVLAAVEAWGDDVPSGKVTSFPMVVKCEPDEIVTYSHVIWPDKKTHDANMKEVMSEMQETMGNNPMPFDRKRMIFASSQSLV